MVAICIGIILFCRVIQAVLNKKSSQDIQSVRTLIGYTAYQNAVSALAGLGLIILSGSKMEINAPTILISLLAGITLFLSVLLGIYAMKSSAIGLSSMFATAGLIVPLIAGALFFHQPVRMMQIFGLIMFFVAAWLLIGSSKELFGSFTLKTFVILVTILLANGGTMLAQQMFTQYVPDGDISVFSFLAFALVSVLGFAVYCVLKPADAHKNNTTNVSGRAFIVNGILLALTLFILNQLATFLTALVLPVVLFTFSNGGGTIASTVVASILYNEKLSVKSVVGVILGIISLIIIILF